MTIIIKNMEDLSLKELKLQLSMAQAKVEILEERLTERTYEVQALRLDRHKTLNFVRELMTELAKDIDVNDVKIVS